VISFLFIVGGLSFLYVLDKEWQLGCIQMACSDAMVLLHDAHLLPLGLS